MGSFGNNIIPSQTGLNLGSSLQRWNSFQQNCDISGSITGNPTFTGIAAAQSFNGVLNASLFSGADIGAKCNAAIATLGSTGGTVFIPTGTYNFSTQIVKPRNVTLSGAGAQSTILNYTGSVGWAIVVGDTLGSTLYPGGGISDLALTGPGSGSTTGGIYIGGGDGGSFNGVNSPPFSSLNYGDNQNINRVRVYLGFGVGIQWGKNAWSTVLSQSVFSNNGVGAYIPNNAGSGERIVFDGCAFLNSTNAGLQTADSNFTDVHCVGCSFDYNNSWAIKNGSAGGNTLLTIQGCHIEQPDHWLQNYDFCNIIGCTFVNGTNSATLGYLIDNQNQGLTVSGSTFFNNGGGVISNPAGQPSIWLGASANTSINSNSGAVIDRFGNATTQNALIGQKITSYNSLTTAGNGVPSEPFQVLSGALAANYNAGSAKTVFTPTATSVLRLTATEYSQNVPTNASLPSLTVSWTDSSNTAQTLAILAVTAAVGAAGVYATNYASTTAKGGTSILITTNNSTPVQITSAGYAAGSGTAMQYALIFTVEVL